MFWQNNIVTLLAEKRYDLGEFCYTLGVFLPSFVTLWPILGDFSPSFVTLLGAN